MKSSENIRPGSLLLDISSHKCTIYYYPENKEAPSTRRDAIPGISMTANLVSNIEELSLLFKTTVDSFSGAIDSASLERIRATIERIYNSIHQEAIKVDAIEVVKHDPVNTNTHDRVILVPCPACHVATKFVVTWDLLLARYNNPGPIMNFLFKSNKTECGHSFVAFVDRTFKLKGCDAIDM
nr:hypothetical protein [Candidatus Sigynarchaeota archaeon]